MKFIRAVARREAVYSREECCAIYSMNLHYISRGELEAPRANGVSDANFQLRLAGTDYYLRCSSVKLEKNGPPCAVGAHERRITGAIGAPITSSSPNSNKMNATARCWHSRCLLARIRREIPGESP